MGRKALQHVGCHFEVIDVLKRTIINILKLPDLTYLKLSPSLLSSSCNVSSVVEVSDVPSVEVDIDLAFRIIALQIDSCLCFFV